MRKLVYMSLLLAVAACGADRSLSPTTPPPHTLSPTSVTGAWTWQGSEFRLTDIALQLSQAQDGALTGTWRGHRAAGGIDSGFVITGGRVGAGVNFQVTALNNDYSITFAGQQLDSAHVQLSGLVFEQGSYQPPVSFLFSR